MKHIQILALSLLIAVSINSIAQDLIITGITDGPLSGNPKLLELYAIHDIDDLSEYSIKAQYNANTDWSAPFTLTGTVSEGEFIYITKVGGVADFNSFFENSITPQESNVIDVNGNDRVGLFNSSDVLIDIFGEIDTDGTGTNWEYVDGWAYRNDDASASATFFESDWYYSGINQLEGGTTNQTCTEPFPIGTYQYTQALELPFVENFDEGTLPLSWTIEGGSNWSISETNNAGGTSSEAAFSGLPETTGTQRMITPKLNTTGMASLKLIIDYYLDFNIAGASFGFATTSDGGNTWNNVWPTPISPSADIGPEDIQLNIVTDDVGSENFQLCFYVTGTSTGFNGWYIDNLTIREISTENDILSFSFPEQTGPATIGDGTIDIEVSMSASLNNLTPEITISQYAEITPESGVAQDFSSAFIYTVTAENDDEQEWTVNVTAATALSSQNEIIDFVLEEQTGPATIDGTAHTVEIEVEMGTDITALIPEITISDLASIYPESGVEMDFTNPVTYTVTAEDGTEQGWEITVNLVYNTETDFLAYSFPQQTGEANIDLVNHEISVEIGYDADIENLIATFELSFGATAVVNGISQESAVTINDFTNPVTYSITAEDGTTLQLWEVTVTQAPIYTETDIISYSLDEQIAPAVIDDINHTVDITVDYGTDLTNLIADFVLSYNASARINGTLQESGITANDFSAPVTYSVTAEDGITKQNWVVTVTEELNNENDILSFELSEQTGPASIDFLGHSVEIEVEYGTDVTALTPTITVSPDAIISPASSVQMDFTNPVTYSVTAQNGDIQFWTVIVTIADSDENDIISFELAEQTAPATINPTAHTVSIEVVYGTNLAELTPTITVSPFANINPGSGVENDFTNPANYIVTAQNGDEQNWTVTVTIEPTIDLSLISQAPIYSCSLTNAETIDIEIENTGDITIASGEIINFTIISGASTLINENITLSADLTPGNTWTGSTTGTIDLSAIGSFEYDASITYDDDMIATNDNYSSYIVHFEQTLEFVNAVNDTITIESSDYPYTIETTLTNNPDSSALVPNYSWDGGGNTSSLVVTESGWYHVTVTTADCIIEESVFVNDYTTISDNKADIIDIYPNPNQGQFTINLNLPNQQDILILVFNSQGKMMHNFQFNDVNYLNEELLLTNCPSGTYILRIITEVNTINKQLIIK
jgi:hypothetical protein